MSKKTAKGASNVSQMILSYLLSLFLVGIALAVVLMITLGRAGYYKSALQKSSYATAVYESLCENYESYGAAAGFSPDVITSFISPEQIEVDLGKAVDAMYAGDISMQEHPEIHEAAMTTMKEDAASRGYEVTADVESALELVADACQADYDNYVCVPLVSQMAGFIDKMEGYALVALIVCLLLALVSIFFITKPRGSAPFKVRLLTFSLLTSAIVCAILTFAVYPMLNLGNLNISPTSLKLLVCNYIHGMFTSFGIFLGIYVVISAALIALEIAARAKAKHRMSKMEGKEA